MKRIAMMVAVVAVLCGCGIVNELRLVGTWRCTITLFETITVRYTFNTDGTMIVVRQDGTSSRGTWTLSGDTLEWIWNESGVRAEFTVDWQLDGSLFLTLVGPLPVILHLYRI